MTAINRSDRVSKSASPYRPTHLPYGREASRPNPTDRPNPFPQPEDPNNHILQIIAIGPRTVVDHYMIRQHQLGYAEPKEWSRPLPAPDGINTMRILTKRFPKRR